MNSKKSYDVTLLPGDGIGHEVTPPCVELINSACTKVDASAINFSAFSAGAQHYADTGISLPEKALEHAQNSDAILLACMGMPSIRYPDGREIAPQLELREKLDLFAGVRPVKTMPGLPLPLAIQAEKKLDFVLIRESTEGLFASREKFRIEGEGEDEAAFDTQVISRRGSERLFHFAFKLAQQRKASGFAGELACVDKANVLGSFYYMRQIFDEISKEYSDVSPRHVYVDAAALQLVSKPLNFDVIVTENMYGDILSDIGAGLMGGMGMAPSADIGLEKAVFQPCHGSAPDILGQGKANPTAMFLSGAMMLEWLGNKHKDASLLGASALIEQAVEHAYATGALLPYELGGKSGTEEITHAVMSELKNI